MDSSCGMSNMASVGSRSSRKMPFMKGSSIEALKKVGVCLPGLMGQNSKVTGPKGKSMEL